MVMDVRDSRVPADDGPGAPPEVMERRSQRTQIEAVRSLEQRVLVARKLSDQKDMYERAICRYRYPQALTPPLSPVFGAALHPVACIALPLPLLFLSPC